MIFLQDGRDLSRGHFRMTTSTPPITTPFSFCLTLRRWYRTHVYYYLHCTMPSKAIALSMTTYIHSLAVMAQPYIHTLTTNLSSLVTDQLLSEQRSSGLSSKGPNILAVRPCVCVFPRPEWTGVQNCLYNMCVTERHHQGAAVKRK